MINHIDTDINQDTFMPTKVWTENRITWIADDPNSGRTGDHSIYLETLRGND